LQIVRIDGSKRRNLLQSFALAGALREAGQPVKNVIIGAEQDQAMRAELEALAGPDDLIVTDNRFTRSAARLIPIGQAVIGSGRSLMEAAALRQTVFTPLANSDLPVLVTLDNWRDLFTTNFSDRSVLPNSKIPTIAQTAAGFADGDARPAVEIARELDVAHAVDRYREMYERPQVPQRHPLDFLLNVAAVLRTSARAARRRRRSASSG
jgi:hypothetical protein